MIVIVKRKKTDISDTTKSYIKEKPNLSNYTNNKFWIVVVDVSRSPTNNLGGAREAKTNWHVLGRRVARATSVPVFPWIVC